MASDRIKRNRRRAAIARRRADQASVTKPVMAQRKVASLPAIIRKSEKKLDRIAAKPPSVVDVKTVPLPAAARPRSITSKIKPAPVARAASISVRRSPAPSVPSRRPSPILPDKLARRLSPSPSKPLKAISGPRLMAAPSITPPSKRSSIASPAPVSKAVSSALHEPQKKRVNSDPPRKPNICKPRPSSSTSKGGVSRPFIPWCG